MAVVLAQRGRRCSPRGVRKARLHGHQNWDFFTKKIKKMNLQVWLASAYMVFRCILDAYYQLPPCEGMLSLQHMGIPVKDSCFLMIDE